MGKWFILKNQNWKLLTCDSFPLIVSHIIIPFQMMGQPPQTVKKWCEVVGENKSWNRAYWPAPNLGKNCDPGPGMIPQAWYCTVLCVKTFFFSPQRSILQKCAPIFGCYYLFFQICYVCIFFSGFAVERDMGSKVHILQKWPPILDFWQLFGVIHDPFFFEFRGFLSR